MNYGYQNEKDFVTLFDKKYLHELDFNSQQFLKDVFKDTIDDTEMIKCWKNKVAQKADIFIKYKNYVKGISIKCGNNNSVHHEQIQEFERYLGNLGIPYKVIDKYVSYHYGYKKDKDGKTDFECLLSSQEYKELYQSELDIFNNYVNKTRIIIDMVDRFIVRGRNSDYDIDFLICGTVEDYVWISKYDLYDLVLSKRCLNFTSPHIACMTIGPQKRCITSKDNIKDRYLVAIRWNFLREDITNFKNNLKQGKNSGFASHRLYQIKKTPNTWCKFHMEQAMGIEPTSQPWQGRVLAVVLRLHLFFSKCINIIS